VIKPIISDVIEHLRTLFIRNNLVGGIPTHLKNMSSSVGIMTFPTEWKNKIHVPSHLRDNILKTERIFSTTSVVKLQFLALEALHPRHRKSLAQKDILPGAWLPTSGKCRENWMKIVVFMMFYLGRLDENRVFFLAWIEFYSFSA
jgi:hypothetical protein